MIERLYLFPGVIEMNVQAQRRLGVNIYLIDGGNEYALIDVGFLDELGEVLELIRRMDFSLSACKLILATHADADHAQGLARAREVLKCKVARPPEERRPAQRWRRNPHLRPHRRPEHPYTLARCKVDRTIDEGDILKIGDKTLEVWSTPGHTAGQLAFRMGNLLFSGDNIFRDGCVGVIDAHHGSNLRTFSASLRRIRAWNADICFHRMARFSQRQCATDATIARLEKYTHMADFGTCALDWPLLDEWDDELALLGNHRFRSPSSDLSAALLVPPRGRPCLPWCCGALFQLLSPESRERFWFMPAITILPPKRQSRWMDIATVACVIGAVAAVMIWFPLKRENRTFDPDAGPAPTHPGKRTFPDVERTATRHPLFLYFPARLGNPRLRATSLRMRGNLECCAAPHRKARSGRDSDPHGRP